MGTHPKAALAGGSPAENAAALERLLGGETGAYHDVLVLNAAAALGVADERLSLIEAAARARAALSSGAAAATLARWKAFR